MGTRGDTGDTRAQQHEQARSGRHRPRGGGVWCETRGHGEIRGIRARTNTSKHAAAGIDHSRHALLDTLPNANEGPGGEGGNEQKRGTHLHPYSMG